MSVQIFDVLELSRIALSPIDGEPFRIRLQFDADIDRNVKEKAISLLRKIGYKQVGNTSTWILSQKPLEVD